MTNRQIEAAAPDLSRSGAAREDAPSSAASGRAGKSRKRDDTWGRALSIKDDERQWLELIEHLPDNARQIWEALLNMRQFWQVLHAFGGQSIRVPRSVPKDKKHALRQHLGVECLRKLMAVFGGTNLYVPRCAALINRLRQRDIIKDFSRSTQRGSSSTAAVSSLARRHGISDRRVWQILKKENSVPPQARLLLKLGDSARYTAGRPDGDR